MAMPPIRPGAPQPTPAQPRSDSARTAAQRAFFQAALGEAQAASSARPVDPTTPNTSRFTAQQQQKAFVPDEPPKRILRPGSFIDIKV
jgi:hypothetical protein